MHRFLAAEELQSHFENVRGAGCRVHPEWANGAETFILQEVEVGAERVRPEWANGAETFVLQEAEEKFLRFPCLLPASPFNVQLNLVICNGCILQCMS